MVLSISFASLVVTEGLQTVCAFSSVPVLPGRPVMLLNSPLPAIPGGLVHLCHSIIGDKGSGSRDNAISFLAAFVMPECNKTVWPHVWLQSDCFTEPKF